MEKMDNHAMRNVIYLGSVIFVFVLSFILYINVDYSRAESRMKKTLDCVQIEKGDTLWEIARRYYSSEFGSMEQYVDEIKRTNLLSEDSIHEGKYLLIPYYYSGN